MNSSTCILKAENLRVSYNGKEALHPVSMEIPRHSITALILSLIHI